GYRQGPDSREDAQRSTDHPSCSGAGCGPFRRLRLLVMREFSRAAFVGQQNGDIGVRESSREQGIDPVLGLLARSIDAEYGLSLVSHTTLQAQVVTICGSPHAAGEPLFIYRTVWICVGRRRKPVSALRAERRSSLGGCGERERAGRRVASA